MTDSYRSVLLKSTSSTQTYMKDNFPSDLGDKIFSVRALTQTAGIGSRGNLWSSESDQSQLYFSLGFISTTNLPFDFLTRTSLHLLRFLHINLGFPVTLKWANDIFLGQAKLSGTNLYPTTSISAFNDSKINPESFYQEILKHFYCYIKPIILNKANFSPLSLVF